MTWTSWPALKVVYHQQHPGIFAEHTCSTTYPFPIFKVKSLNLNPEVGKGALCHWPEHSWFSADNDLFFTYFGALYIYSICGMTNNSQMKNYPGYYTVLQIFRYTSTLIINMKKKNIWIWIYFKNVLHKNNYRIFNIYFKQIFH